MSQSEKLTGSAEIQTDTDLPAACQSFKPSKELAEKLVITREGRPRLTIANQVSLKLRTIR